MNDPPRLIIDVTTPEGVMPTYVHTPHGAGPWPAARHISSPVLTAVSSVQHRILRSAAH